MRTGVFTAIAFACTVLFAAPALAGQAVQGCCGCLTEGGSELCPASGAVCFTTLRCGDKCAALGCGDTFSTEGAVCGEGGFNTCEVIDPGTPKPAPALSLIAVAALSMILLALQMWRQRRRTRA